mmetsp:Transcript_935/g.1275  ORF Transcript_935/g.1275 Transcript_935/m.1275 type:complete len:266 (+) Transcript_935:83-880(+)
MVKAGEIIVHLVAADTKEPFKEHIAPDGQIYAEVEPDMDYFISVSSTIRGARFDFHVDGVDLGYSSRKLKSRYYGHRERKDGKETMTALHFNKTREAQDVAPDMLTGKVEVKAYEIGTKYYTQRGADNFVSASLAADSTFGGKKCIKSTTNGSFEIIRSLKRRKGDLVSKYKTGKHIFTVTINYCSALGLIYHKILPPPPALEEDVASAEMIGGRKRKRSTIPSQVAAAAVSPEMNNDAGNTKTAKHETVTVQLTYDLVDLTGDD